MTIRLPVFSMTTAMSALIIYSAAHAQSTIVQPVTEPETIKVHDEPRPSIQNYPHAGVVGQPRRVYPLQNVAPNGHQGRWGNFTRGNGESAGFGPVGRYGVAPWAEDWSYLRDPKLRNDPLDILKFIPLNDQKTIWLSFSGETRLRNWYEEHPGLGASGHPGSGRFTARNLYGADLHLGSHIRLFGQLINGDAAGWNGYGYGTTYRKKLDAQQAFIEITENMFGAKTGFLFGRQQFLDAPSYLLYNRETPNVPISWNGFRYYAIWDSIRIDAYDFVQTNINQTKMFHDTEDYGTRLYGFNTTVAVPAFHIGKQQVHSFLDLFYIGYKYAGSAAAISTATGTKSGFQTRNNFGFRWYGSAPSFEYSIGADYQGGTFNYAKTDQKRSVDAYAINATFGYRKPASFLHPFIGIQTDIYSGGNSHKTTGSVGTFATPFSPQTNYLDTTTYIAPANLISMSPILSITPRHYISLRLKAPVLWRESTSDAVYSSSARYAFSTGLNGRYVGIVPQASLLIQLNQHLSWQMYGARFIVSHNLREAGAKSGSYAQSNLVFRF